MDQAVLFPMKSVVIDKAKVDPGRRLHLTYTLGENHETKKSKTRRGDLDGINVL